MTNTIYGQILRRIFCTAVFLLGMQEAIFSSSRGDNDDTLTEETAGEEGDPNKKKGYFSRARSAANKVRNDVKDYALESAPGKEAAKVAAEAQEVMSKAECALKCKSKTLCQKSTSLSNRCAYACPSSPCGLAATKEALARKSMQKSQDEFTDLIGRGGDRGGLNGLVKNQSSSTQAEKGGPTWYKNDVDIGLNRYLNSCDSLKGVIYDIMVGGFFMGKGILSIKEQKYILGQKCPYEPIEKWLQRNPNVRETYKKNAIKLSNLSEEVVENLLRTAESQFPETLAQNEFTQKQTQKVLLANAFKTMKLPETATEDEVRQQFKKLALLLHPDKGGKEEDFKAMVAAHELLKLHFENLPSMAAGN